MNKPSDFFNIYQQPFEFFVLNEPEFEAYAKHLSHLAEPPITSKPLSTLGLITDFDTNSFRGELQYKDSFIKVDFSHMASTFKWIKRFYYFIYGILEVIPFLF